MKALAERYGHIYTAVCRNPEGLSRPQLAEKLGVTYSVVRYAQVGRTWKEVVV